MTELGLALTARVGTQAADSDGVADRAEFVLFLQYPQPIHRVVSTTNLVESLNARFRQAHPPSVISRQRKPH